MVKTKIKVQWDDMIKVTCHHTSIGIDVIKVRKDGARVVLGWQTSKGNLRVLYELELAKQ